MSARKPPVKLANISGKCMSYIEVVCKLPSPGFEACCKNRITIFYKGKHYAWKTWQAYEKITQLRSRIDGKVIPVIFYCQNL
jgi:hypothetical protein